MKSKKKTIEDLRLLRYAEVKSDYYGLLINTISIFEIQWRKK